MFVLSLVLFAGCAEMELANDAREMSGGTAYGCMESDRLAVDDPALASRGFAFAAQDAIDAMTGMFEGNLIPMQQDGTDGSPMLARMQVRVAGTVEVVSFEMSDGDGNQYATADAAPEGQCTARYEVPVVIRMVVGKAAAPLVDASYEAVLAISSADLGSAWATLTLDEVDGSAVPTSFDPTEMDETSLSLYLWSQDGTWRGSLDWSGTQAQDGQVGTGVMEPMGSLEMVPEL